MTAIIDYREKSISPVVSVIKEIDKDCNVTSGEIEILKSDKIILPDGEDASSIIKHLHKCNLFTMLRVCKKPVLGIGLGMQIMADLVKEAGASGLGIFHSSTEEFDIKISSSPFTGMNGIKIQKSGPMFEGFRLSERFYFHNSFYLPLNKNTTSFANNGIAFTASLESGNFYGVQFLPDKSGEAGIKLLKNFLEL